MKRRETQETLQPLVRMRGVRAVVVASEDDALVIDAHAHVDVDADALAAFGVSIVRRARLAGMEIGAGAPQVIALESEGGRLIAAVRDDLLVLTLTGEDAQEGLVRLTAQRVADALGEQLARRHTHPC
jgi:predicted regulator of Ras-like GTPase activity (Roadblock/LC7/MglB family)